MAHKNVTCEICGKDISTRGIARHMEAHSRKGEKAPVEAAVAEPEAESNPVSDGRFGEPTFKTDESDCPACKGHGVLIRKIDGVDAELQCGPCLGTGNKNLEHDYTNTNTNETETEMAAKKKASSKKSAAKAPKAPKAKAEKPVGRGRKLLLRLSHEEYAALQAKAAKLETTMADLLRTGALG